MDGERTIAAKTRSRKRPATEVAPAAEMPATMAAAMKMTSTSVTTSTVATTTVATAAVATAAVATAASRGCITSSRQRGRKNNDGNADIEF
jgi:hypothetical protein